MSRLRYLSMEFYLSQVAIRRVDSSGLVKVHLYKVDLDNSSRASMRLYRIILMFRLDITRRVSRAMYLSEEAKRQEIAKQLEEADKQEIVERLDEASKPKKRRSLFGKN